MLSTLLITAAHLAALGQLESGNNDHAIGKHGEVSRYQIMPKVWRRATSIDIDASKFNEVSSHVCEHILSNRISAFQTLTARNPTDYELALLWHCPARLIHPARLTKSDKDYAQRFVNLLEAEQKKGKAK